MYICSVLDCFGPFFITFALDPEKMISPLANCLGGQNLRLNGEGYLISSKL